MDIIQQIYSIVYADVRVQGRFAGAILGSSEGRVYNSHGRGTVTGKRWSSENPYSYAGGLLGGGAGSVTKNSYAWAEVLGDYRAGSLIGGISEGSRDSSVLWWLAQYRHR